MVEKSEVVAGQEIIYLSLPTNNIWTSPFYRWPSNPYVSIDGWESFYGDGTLGPNPYGFVVSPVGTVFAPSGAEEICEWSIVEGYCLEVRDIPDDTTATIKFTLTLNWSEEEHDEEDWIFPSVCFANWPLDSEFITFGSSMEGDVFVDYDLSWADGLCNITFDVTFPLFPDELGIYSTFALEVSNLPAAYYWISYDSFTMNFTSESLQSEDAKSNELLQAILDAMNGSTNPKPPAGSGSVGDLGSIEDSLLGDSAAGRDEFSELIDTSIVTLGSYAIAFSFMAFVINEFIAVGWVRHALIMSLSLGVFAYLLNISFRSSGDGRSGSNRSGKGKGG